MLNRRCVSNTESWGDSAVGRWVAYENKESTLPDLIIDSLDHQLTHNISTHFLLDWCLGIKLIDVTVCVLQVVLHGGVKQFNHAVYVSVHVVL